MTARVGGMLSNHLTESWMAESLGAQARSRRESEVIILRPFSSERGCPTSLDWNPRCGAMGGLEFRLLEK